MARMSEELKADSLVCPNCSRVYSILSKYHFQQHIKTCGTGAFHCSMCQATFSTKHTLKRHVNLHLEPVSHTCDVCNRSFSTKFSLHSHKKTHTDISKRTADRIKCNFCEKTFQWKNSLGRHLEIHKVKASYVCACNLVHTRYSAFRRHRQKCSVYNNTKKAKCDFSLIKKQNSSQQHDLNKVKTEADNTGIVHTCQLCLKGFVNRYDFEEHVENCDLDFPARCMEKQSHTVTEQCIEKRKSKDLTMHSLSGKGESNVQEVEEVHNVKLCTDQVLIPRSNQDVVDGSSWVSKAEKNSDTDVAGIEESNIGCETNERKTDDKSREFVCNIEKEGESKLDTPVLLSFPVIKVIDSSFETNSVTKQDLQVKKLGAKSDEKSLTVHDKESEFYDNVCASQVLDNDSTQHLASEKVRTEWESEDTPLSGQNCRRSQRKRTRKKVSDYDMEFGDREIEPERNISGENSIRNKDGKAKKVRINTVTETNNIHVKEHFEEQSGIKDKDTEIGDDTAIDFETMDKLDEAIELQDLNDTDCEMFESKHGGKHSGNRGKTFSDNVLLNLPIKCMTDNCEDEVTGIREITKHKLQKHKEKLNFVCLICDKCYSRRNTLHEHLIMCHYDLSYSKLGLHNAEIMDKDIAVYMCTKCQYVCKGVQIEPPGVHICVPKPLRYFCPYCATATSSRKFETFEDCASHLQSEHSGTVDESEENATRYSSLKSEERDPASRIIEGETECYVCKQTFSVLDDLKKHVNSKHASHPYCCGVCRQAYGRKSGLMMHMSSHQHRTRCNICGKGFSNKKDLTRHLATHTGERPVKCDQCERRFCDDAGLRRHQQLTHGVESRLVNHSTCICELCGKMFTHTLKLKQHLSSHQESEKRSCDYCFQLLKKESFESHKLKCSKFKKDNFDKVMVPNDLASKKSMYQTLISYESEHDVGKKFKCNLCSSRFRTRKFAVCHVNRCHTFDNQRRLVCSLCNKGFVRELAYRIHLRSHSGAKPYRCRICGNSYRQIGHVRQHLYSHGKVVFKCRYCFMKFKTKQTLDHHVQIHSMFKPYVCLAKQCDRAYKSIEQMVQHFKKCPKHLRDNSNMLCKLCMASFTKEHESIVHILTHQNDQLDIYKCESCPQTFASFKKLYHHMDDKNHFKTLPHLASNGQQVDSQAHEENNGTLVTDNSRNFTVEEIVWDGSLENLLNQYDYIPEAEQFEVAELHTDQASDQVIGPPANYEEVVEDNFARNVVNKTENLVLLASHLTNIGDHVVLETPEENHVNETNVQYDIGNVISLPEENDNSKIVSGVSVIPDNAFGNAEIIDVARHDNTNDGKEEVADMHVDTLESNTAESRVQQDNGLGGLHNYSLLQHTQPDCERKVDSGELEKAQNEPHLLNGVAATGDVNGSVEDVSYKVVQELPVEIKQDSQGKSVSITDVAISHEILGDQSAGLNFIKEGNLMDGSRTHFKVFDASGNEILLMNENGEMRNIMDMAELENLQLDSVTIVQLDESYVENASSVPTMKADLRDLETDAVVETADQVGSTVCSMEGTGEIEREMNRNLGTDILANQIHESDHYHSKNASEVCEKNFEIEFNAGNASYCSDKINEKVYMHKCSVCNKLFKKLKSLNFHKKIHLQSSQRRYQCSECDQGFNLPSQLQIHQRKHTGERPFVCKQCGKSFKQVGHLQIHLRMHEGVYAFECMYCGKKFITNSHRKKHLQKHHSKEVVVGDKTGTQEKKWRCEKCDETFPEEADLSNHKLNHLSEEKQLSFLKDFSLSDITLPAEKKSSCKSAASKKEGNTLVCDVCGAILRSSRVLAVHVAKHRVNEGKLFQCKMCNNKFFEDEKQLLDHTDSYHKYAIQCDQCGVQLGGTAGLRKHKRQVHSVTEWKCSNCCRVFVSKTAFVNHVTVCYGNVFQDKLQDVVK